MIANKSIVALEKPSINRMPSVDSLKGDVMTIMASDHVRDYFHSDSFIFYQHN